MQQNLDVMHVDKNFFEYFSNIILNVQAKTKDHLKSKLYLVYTCTRKELHVGAHGKCHVPIYPLDASLEEEFIDWIIHSSKYLDGYTSNLRNCVSRRTSEMVFPL